MKLLTVISIFLLSSISFGSESIFCGKRIKATESSHMLIGSQLEQNGSPQKKLFVNYRGKQDDVIKTLELAAKLNKVVCIQSFENGFLFKGEIDTVVSSDLTGVRLISDSQSELGFSIELPAAD